MAIAYISLPHLLQVHRITEGEVLGRALSKTILEENTKRIAAGLPAAVGAPGGPGQEGDAFLPGLVDWRRLTRRAAHFHLNGKEQE